MRTRSGFTLIEIMLVVAIIALLALLAYPSYSRARTDTQNTRFLGDLRIAADAFTMYAMNNRAYPPDGLPGVIPADMSDYLVRMNWDQDATIGGQWDWDYLQFGYTAGVSIYQPNRSANEMQTIDAKIDDGNLATGQFRQRALGYIYILEF